MSSFFYDIKRDGMEISLDIEVTYSGQDIEWEISGWAWPDDVDYRADNPPDLTDDETEAINQSAWEVAQDWEH